MVRSVKELRDESAMQDLDMPVFNDPGLKAVLRRNYPPERATQYLRERIRQSLNASSSVLPVSLAASAPARPPASPRPSFPKSAEQTSSPIRVTHPAAIAAPSDWTAVMPGLAIAAMMLVAIGTI